MSSSDWAAAAAIATAVLQRHHGVAKLHRFLAAGLTGRQVAALTHQGVLERPRSGWYVDPALPWQAKHAIRVGGVLTCESACSLLGLPVPPGSWCRLHVLLPGNAARVRHHRDRRHYVVPGEDTEVVTHWSISDGTAPGWRSPLVDSLVELAECVPTDWWIAALDAARHRPRGGEPLLDDDGFAKLAALLPRRRRRALGLVDPLAESCIETLLRLAMRRRGIGPFVLQFVPTGAFRCDFLVGRRLIVEADGEQFHDPEKDAIRDAILRALGYTVLRFTYREIVADIENVLDRIEAALASLSF